MKPKRKRIMEAFKISEISAVDHPAQEHARMTIMKRADDKPKEAMSAFNSFDDLVGHYKKLGISGVLAMKMARSARPDLFTRMQDRPHQTTSEEAVIAKSRAGRARQNQIEAAVDEIARSGGISKMAAARQLRDQRPSLFA